MHDPTLDLARPRAGSVDLWVRCVVVLAIACTFAVLISGPRVVYARDSDTLDLPRFWFHNTLALGFLATLVIACLPSARGSRFVRLAVLLPIVQLATLIVTWVVWLALRSRMPVATDATPLFEKLPVRVVLPWTLFAIALGARLAARRRRREWLHASLMLSLVYLLLLGLWLPIASNAWNGQGWDAWEDVERALDHPGNMVAFVAVPPYVGALVFTATALRWPAVWRRNSAVVFALLILALVIDIATRCDVVEVSAFVYLNFIHLIACAGIAGVTALTVLGAVTWIGQARARRRLAQRDVIRGRIETSGTVALLELTSWLRGPRALCDAFTVVTPYGEVPVPAGVRVAAPTPLATTLLRAGEIVQVLQPNDEVVVAGFVRAKSDGPFRATSAPIPGATGITVGRVGDERYGFTHVALDLWRPAIAYLLILVAVALPGLAALLTKNF